MIKRNFFSVALLFLLLYSCKKDDVVYNQLPTTFVIDTLTEVLTGFEILPNPFDSNTTIQFYLHKNDSITISIYNMSGMKLYQNIISTAPQGFYRFALNLAHLPQGIYYTIIGVGEKNYVKKILKL